MSSQREAQKAVSDITNFLKAELPADAPLRARLKFVYPDVGVVFIDGRKTPITVHNRDDVADCSVEIDPLLHLKMLHREYDQGLAFRQGKMRISGDVAVAVRLGPLLLTSKAADRS
jgi:hypothetical protein